MGVYRFEDLRVWQAAKAQSDRVGKLLNRPDFIRDRPLADRMNAAALAVVFNISEGFLRRRHREMLQFLRCASVLNGEVKAALLAAEGRGYLQRSEFGGLIAGNESIARMLRRWQASLENEAIARTAGAAVETTARGTTHDSPS
jgi:four helix bundle protein